VNYRSRRPSGPQQPVHHLQRRKLLSRLPRPLAVAALLVAAAWPLLPAPPPPVASALNPAYCPPPDQRALQALLQQLHRSWNPEQRQRLLATVAEQKKLLLRPLRVLLAQAEPDPLLPEALACAFEMHDDSLTAQIVHWTAAGSGAVRSLAITTAAQHGAVEAGQLGDLLADADPVVRAAAATIAIDRGNLPWDRVAQGLASLPRTAIDELSPRQDKSRCAPLASALWTIAIDGQAKPANAALQALTRLDLAGEFAAAAVSRLREAPPATTIALLNMIAAAAVPLPDPAPLLRLALDGNAQLRLRARAVYCLERARCGDLEQLQTAGPGLPPLLRLGLARCHIARGDDTGIAMLLQLAESEDQPTAAQSRILLGCLTGLGPNAGIEDWQRQLGEQPVAQVRLPPPDLP